MVCVCMGCVCLGLLGGAGVCMLCVCGVCVGVCVGLLGVVGVCTLWCGCVRVRRVVWGLRLIPGNTGCRSARSLHPFPSCRPAPRPARLAEGLPVRSGTDLSSPGLAGSPRPLSEAFAPLV